MFIYLFYYLLSSIIFHYLDHLLHLSSNCRHLINKEHTEIVGICLSSICPDSDVKDQKGFVCKCGEKQFNGVKFFTLESTELFFYEWKLSQEIYKLMKLLNIIIIMQFLTFHYFQVENGKWKVGKLKSKMEISPWKSQTYHIRMWHVNVLHLNHGKFHSYKYK